MSRRRAKKTPRVAGHAAEIRSAHTTALHLLFLSTATLALYARGLSNTFVTDDESEVLNDRLLRSFANIPRLFSHGVWFFEGVQTENYYRPLKLLAYSVEYHLFGFHPTYWHVASIVLHVGVVAAAYLLVRDLSSRRLAFWSGLLFALHPVHVEAVAWIAGGQDLLCGQALLFATWLYHLGRSGAPPRLYFGLSAALFFLGLLAKEVALTFPAVILAYDFFYRGTSLREMLQAWRRYIPYFAALGVYSLLRVHAIKGFAPVTSGMRLTPTEMVLSVPVLAVKYIGLALLPIHLNYWHVYKPVQVLSWKPLAAATFVTALVAAAFRLRRVQPALSFALAWFWLTLTPVLAIPKVSGNVFTERYLYIPSFAYCVFAGWGFLWVREKASGPTLRRAVYAGLVIVLLSYVALAVRRIPDWHDTLTLMQKTAKQSPDSPYVVGTLGYIYFQRGRFDEALRYEQRAVTLEPTLAGLWVNLGAAYNAMQQWQSAIDACRRGLDMDPDHPVLLNQMALALWQNDQRDKALADWQRAVQADPTDLDARVNFATSLFQLGQLDAAVDELVAGLRASRDVRASPDAPEAYMAHFKLGYIYEQKGAWHAAAQEYQQVLQIKSDFGPAREQLEALRAHLKESGG
jgi:protein O-mannosyl-transferase